MTLKMMPVHIQSLDDIDWSDDDNVDILIWITAITVGMTLARTRYSPYLLVSAIILFSVSSYIKLK